MNFYDPIGQCHAEGSEGSMLLSREILRCPQHDITLTILIDNIHHLSLGRTNLIMLHGEKIYLRPVRQDDLPILAARANDLAFQTEFNFFGLQHNGLEKHFQEDGLLSRVHGTLLVVACESEQIVGDVSYRQVRYGPGDMSIAYNIGIGLAQEHRGKGYGVEAQVLLADYLFAVFPIMRVEATTDITNSAEQRALEKAGFTREGVLRKAQWRNGNWHDLVVYSKLRGE
jgi:RimJ/RimL family protein N-acetyltransferase